MDWNNHKILNNFQKWKLGGFERLLHSCLQICNDTHFLLFELTIWVMP
jgi:hypothetical protein